MPLQTKYYHVLILTKSKVPTLTIGTNPENVEIRDFTKRCIQATENTEITCGTYAIDPWECTDPWIRHISPRIEFNNDDLPEPTWKQITKNYQDIKKKT